jgi:hypothetical protein
MVLDPAGVEPAVRVDVGDILGKAEGIIADVDYFRDLSRIQIRKQIRTNRLQASSAS